MDICEISYNYFRELCDDCVDKIGRKRTGNDGFLKLEPTDVDTSTGWD